MTIKFSRLLVFDVVLMLAIAFAGSAVAATAVPGPYARRLAGSYTFQENGWTYVHLQGTPEDIGFQHGYLLARQIEDFYRVLKVESTHNTPGYSWAFYRKTAQEIFWPHINAEYRAELKGIAAGVKARGGKVDLWDIVVMNGQMEIEEYYIPWLEHEKDKSRPKVSKAPGNCSAFIATGNWTKGGQIVMAHNNWTNYADGERWTMIFDIQPEHGYRILMDGAPGLITSNDDFGENSDGLMITETTISGFVGWNSKGIPEFVRSRDAMQYAGNIDQYARIMETGNNGAYANDWLIGDRKTGEIGYLELGLTHVKLWKKKDGYFVSSNFARLPGLIRDETVGYDPKDMSSSPNARHMRWLQLMKEYKGRIDVQLAEKFLGDHYDTWLKKIHPDQRTLCGHVDFSKEGVPVWGDAPYAPDGAVQGKATDSAMVAKMELVAHAGHPGGESFYVKPFLKAHPQFDWEKPILRDMIAYPWTEFKSDEKATK
jgi:hypothetical protein